MKSIIRIILFSLVILLLTNACSLKPNSKKYSICGTFREEPVYTFVDESCKFPKGMRALMDYLKNETYPPDSLCMCEHLTGRVIVSFTVAKDGSIHQIQVIRGVAPALDKEAIRIVKAMPKWKPAKIKGKTVHQRFVLPISFRLI